MTAIICDNNNKIPNTSVQMPYDVGCNNCNYEV